MVEVSRALMKVGTTRPALVPMSGMLVQATSPGGGEGENAMRSVEPLCTVLSWNASAGALICRAEGSCHTGLPAGAPMVQKTVSLLQVGC